jgi:hypothetical protein
LVSPFYVVLGNFIIIIFMRNTSKKEIPKGPQCTICMERTSNVRLFLFSAP